MSTDMKVLGKYGLWSAAIIGSGVAGYLAYKYVLKLQAEKEAEVKQQQMEFDWKKEEEGYVFKNDGVEPEFDKQTPEQLPLGKEGDILHILTDEEKTKKLSPTEIAKKIKKEKVQVTDYTAMSRKLSKPPLKDIAKEHLGEEVVEETQSDPDAPHVIQLEEYAHSERKGFDKMVLTYYEKDDILCDPNNTVISVPDELIGEDGLLKFGTGTDDPDSVYISNPLTSTNYEVVRLHKAYQTEIMGVKPEKKRAKPNVRKVTKINDDDSEE